MSRLDNQDFEDRVLDKIAYYFETVGDTISRPFFKVSAWASHRWWQRRPS